MSGGYALERLKRERKLFRKERPAGFFAKPMRREDGATDLFTWECGIPGKPKTPWEGGLYKCTLHFSERYPTAAPAAKFTPPVFHPNVYTCGDVCLSLLKPEEGWKPTITITEVLKGLQDLLNEPNSSDPANPQAGYMQQKHPKKYEAEVRAMARKYKAHK